MLSLLHAVCLKVRDFYCFYSSFTVQNWYFCVCVRKLKRSASEITALLLPTILSVKYLLVFHSVDCGLWIAPHNCNGTVTPLFPTIQTYKWSPVRKRNTDILRLLDALHQVVLHFFTSLTTALLIGKVNSYSFKDFAHHQSLLSSTHTHTHLHSKNPVTSTQWVASFPHSLRIYSLHVG